MAKKTGTQNAQLVPQTPETELGFVRQVGDAVVAWLKGAAAFLKRADQYEARAAEVLALAKTLKPATNGAEDVKLQEFILTCNRGKSTVESHWNGSKTEPGPTVLLHRLHRRATAKRDRAIQDLDDANAIANKLHNQWTQAERDRAEAETRRLQAIEDAKAQAKRDKELAELEAIALKQEAASEDLSEREQKFVIAIAVNYDPALAAREAGYKDAAVTAERLLKSRKIVKAIAARQEANAVRQQAQAIAAAPVVATVVEVQADVQKAAGAKDVTRWKAKIENEQAFINAVFAGEAGIPRDVLCIDVSKLNQYARDLKHVINRWPGVKAVPDTKVQ